MAHMEMLNFGVHPDSPGSDPVILGRSGGINQDMAAEISRLCLGWGEPATGKNPRPALLSLPLVSKAGWAKGGCFAVIRVLHQPVPCFQVGVLDRSEYGRFGFNPFAVIAARVFPEWQPYVVPESLALPEPVAALAVNPGPSAADVGMIDEALNQILAVHKLHFPLAESTEQSERFLALLIEIMPVALKAQLRFASYATSTVNGYHLAAIATPNCSFDGWQRLMMAQMVGQLPEKQARYVKKVRDCLAFGDISRIEKDSRSLSLSSRSIQPGKKPVSGPPKKVKALASALPTASIRKDRVLRKKPKGNSVDSRTGAPRIAQYRGKQRRLSGPLVILMVLAVTLAGGWGYLEFFNGGRPLPWSQLLSGQGLLSKHREDRVSSLLEVANVAEVYAEQLKKINRAKKIPGLSPESERAKGLVRLKAEAAEPLQQQVDLFLELAEAGIRQGERPDRESERLRALSRQGVVLKVEMSRLELAWFSLTTGIDWRDLSQLKDPLVLARRDSLAKEDKKFLVDSSRELGIGKRDRKLIFALEQTKGMSHLLVQFQATEWSPRWSKDTFQAAELVSPSASSMTRAYRNSAFTLVRLKNAEHLKKYAAAAFCVDLSPGAWPTEVVAEILPGLRRQVGKFGNHEAPPLLAGTLALYQILEDPTSTLQDLATGRLKVGDLKKNPAYVFDPPAYADYLDRICFEAALISNNEGEIYDPETFAKIKAFADARRQGLTADQWSEVASRSDGFLQEWANQKVVEIEQGRQEARARFRRTYAKIAEQTEELSRLSAQGRDWTEQWISLDRNLDLGLLQAAGLPAGDKRKLALEQLRQEMDRPRELVLGQVTVRLEQPLLQNPREVILELKVPGQRERVASAPFTLGPAAPAGSGWVGTVNCDQRITLAANQACQGIVRLVDDGSQLLTINYPSLKEGVGPGAFGRPRKGRGGNLRLKSDDRWWRDLRLPVLSDQKGPS